MGSCLQILHKSDWPVWAAAASHVIYVASMGRLRAVFASSRVANLRGMNEPSGSSSTVVPADPSREGATTVLGGESVTTPADAIPDGRWIASDGSRATAPADPSGDGPYMIGSTTVTGCVTEAVAPRLSVTVSLTLYVPAASYSCDAVAPVPLLPSPKSHAYSTMSPSASDESDAYKGQTRFAG